MVWLKEILQKYLSQILTIATMAILGLVWNFFNGIADAPEKLDTAEKRIKQLSDSVIFLQGWTNYYYQQIGNGQVDSLIKNQKLLDNRILFIENLIRQSYY